MLKPMDAARKSCVGNFPPRPRYVLPPGPLGRCCLRNSRRQFDPPMLLVWAAVWLFCVGVLLGIWAAASGIIDWLLR